MLCSWRSVGSEMAKSARMLIWEVGGSNPPGSILTDMCCIFYFFASLFMIPLLVLHYLPLPFHLPRQCFWGEIVRVGDYWFMVQCTELLIIFCQYSSSVNSFSGSSKQSSVISVGEYMIPEKPKGFAQVVSRRMISAFQVSRHMSWVESIKAMNSLWPPTYSLLWPVGLPGVHGLRVNCIYLVVYCWFHFNHH